MRSAFREACNPKDITYKERENTVDEVVVYQRFCSMRFKQVDKIFYLLVFIINSYDLI